MALDGSAGLLTLVEPDGMNWSAGPGRELVQSILEEQRDLSAVERFAQFHGDADGPLQGRYYSALMPAQAPGRGQQLAFEVDLDRCSGCKACVAACHNLNGLDEGESWRDVGLLIGGLSGLPILQHVTTACHHCLDPACASACPVNAYEKDPKTGIVRHLDDQCIGCQYCTLACPYDAPKYNVGKGIVRKCDMCHDRLAVGEAPACVQACPHEAIRIRVVDNAEVLVRAQESAFVASTVDPAVTLPTTYFRTDRVLGPGEMRPVDDRPLEPEHAHWPLIMMLAFTQLSAGGFAVELGGIAAGPIGSRETFLHTILCLAFGWAGLGASVLHLGRPLHAYRALIGLKHSWLSREVLAFGLFVTLATVYVAIGLLFPAWFAAQWGMRAAFLGLVVAAGFAGVACSVLVYHVVLRPSWRATYCGVRFAGTALVLGLAMALASSSVASLGDPGIVRSSAYSSPLIAFALCLIASSSAKLCYEAWMIHRFARSYDAALRKTHQLLVGPLQRPARLRRLLGVVGGVALPVVAVAGVVTANPPLTAAAAVLALTASICGEVVERYLFFTAASKPTLPGGLLR